MLASCYCNNTPKVSSLERKEDLLWFTVYKGSVHGYWLVVSSISRCGMWQSKQSLTSFQNMKEGERQKDWGPNIPFWGTPPMTARLHSRAYFLNVSPPLNSTVNWGSSPLWGTVVQTLEQSKNYMLSSLGL